jgi:hypothetical protein
MVNLALIPVTLLLVIEMMHIHNQVAGQCKWNYFDQHYCQVVLACLSSVQFQNLIQSLFRQADIQEPALACLSRQEAALILPFTADPMKISMASAKGFIFF